MESSLAYRILRDGIDESAIGISRDELNQAERAVSWISWITNSKKRNGEKYAVGS